MVSPVVPLMPTIVLAISGGIDSAVAAHLLREQGVEVCPLFMKHSYQREDETDAIRVTEHLNLPLEILDISAAFETVVEHFADEYFAGRTPNPCVFCNRTIKFGLLLQHAFKRGADGFATGHYVCRGDINGFPALFQGVDPTKDQSYVLYGIDKEVLPRLHFPLGGYEKAAIREMAIKLGLPNTQKAESQDICFIERGKHAEFLQKRRPKINTAGRFVSPDGNILGNHKGFVHYTVGQRKGMGVGFGERIFVHKIDAATNNVVIGPYADLAQRSLTARDVRWLLPEEPKEIFRCEAKTRYRTENVPVTVTPLPDGAVNVEFEKPRYGIAPGQSVVFYENTRLLGGGVIINL